MNTENAPHDNVDVKLQNRMTFNHSHITIIFAPIIVFGFIVFGSWIIFFPHAYLAVVPWIIGSVLIIGGLAVVSALVAFGVHFIARPVVHLIQDARHSFTDARIKWHRRDYLESGPNHAAYLEDRKVVVKPVIQERHNHIHKPELPAAEEPKQIEGPPLPEYVRYEDVRYNVPHGHTLLGCQAGGRVVTKPFKVLDTMWIVGGSKTGKTNDIVIKVEEGHNVGRRLLVVDPHKTKSDSLYNAIRGYERDFLQPVAHTHEEIKQTLTAFKDEAIRRIAGGSYRDGWTLIVDEVGALTGAPGLRDEEQTEMYRLIAPIAKMCGEQLRGYDMSGWFISQSPIGLAWLANSAMTVFVHKMIKENQQKLATNSNTAVMDDMTNWPRGRVFCYGLDIQGEYLLQQPVITARVVDAAPPTLPNLAPNPFTQNHHSVNAVNGMETPSEARSWQSVNVTAEMSDDAQKPFETSSVGNDIRGIIVRLHEQKMPLGKIAEAVGLNGRKYPMFMAVCQELGIRK